MCFVNTDYSWIVEMDWREVPGDRFCGSYHLDADIVGGFGEAHRGEQGSEFAEPPTNVDRDTGTYRVRGELGGLA